MCANIGVKIRLEKSTQQKVQTCRFILVLAKGFNVCSPQPSWCDDFATLPQLHTSWTALLFSFRPTTIWTHDPWPPQQICTARDTNRRHSNFQSTGGNAYCLAKFCAWSPFLQNACRQPACSGSSVVRLHVLLSSLLTPSAPRPNETILVSSQVPHPFIVCFSWHGVNCSARNFIQVDLAASIKLEISPSKVVWRSTGLF